MALTTSTHEVGLLGMEARIELSDGHRPMLFLKDTDDHMVLLLPHELVSLRDLLNTLDLS